jgi:hypothetical protein
LIGVLALRTISLGLQGKLLPAAPAPAKAGD